MSFGSWMVWTMSVIITLSAIQQNEYMFLYGSIPMWAIASIIIISEWADDNERRNSKQRSKK